MNDSSHEQMLQELKDIVNDVTDGELTDDDFRGDMSVLEDVGLNSVDFLELAFEIEKKWDITINDDEFREIRTVDDVVRTIAEKVRAKAGQGDSEPT
ncbi:MAG: acyl carrier protein [bacterium]|nr:acyl carrier protein [bacterium]